jgi:hypothetical protein
MSDSQDNTDVRDATPEEETMISTILAQRDRIEELEAELAGAINVAYEVSEAAGKRRGELETKLVDVEGRLFNCAMDLNIYIDLVEKLQEELDNRERSNEL